MIEPSAETRVPDLSDSEQQALIAYSTWEWIHYQRTSSRPRPIAPGQLRGLGNQLCPEPEDNWEVYLEQLAAKNLVESESGTYLLTPAGRSIALSLRNRLIGNMYDHVLLRCLESPTYERFCRAVFGRCLYQFDLLDMGQLSRLLGVLQLDSTKSLLDLGCGPGLITQYIGEVTGADVTGVDLAASLVHRERCQGKTGLGRVTFYATDMRRLECTGRWFDAIIAIDSLYYLEDLTTPLAQWLDRLRPGGQIAIFHSDVVAESRNRAPGFAKTRIAQALRELDLPYRRWDFSATGDRIWRTKQRVLEDLAGEFETEGNREIYERLASEVETAMQWVEAGQTRRYLYHVRVA